MFQKFHGPKSIRIQTSTFFFDQISDIRTLSEEEIRKNVKVFSYEMVDLFVIPYIYTI